MESADLSFRGSVHHKEVESKGALYDGDTESVVVGRSVEIEIVSEE